MTWVRKNFWRSSTSSPYSEAGGPPSKDVDPTISLGYLEGLRTSLSSETSTKRELSTSTFSVCLVTVCPTPLSYGITTLLGFPWLTGTSHNSRNAKSSPRERRNPCNDAGSRLTERGGPLLERTRVFL